MKIIEKTYTLNGDLSVRAKTNRIILHHAAATNCTAEDVDRWHKNNGWTCIGYHFFVNKKGEIYRGRREDSVGAHAYGANSDSIGICAEGNFENEVMQEAQKQAIKELVAYLKNKYGISKVQGHKDVCATSCPGKNYPFKEIARGETSKATYSHTDFVKDVQRATGAKVDGIAGNETFSKTVTISKSKNSKHAVVKAVQKYLITLGYSLSTYGADGCFGKETETAVKKYQSANGCVVDGEITARNRTWKKLLKLI